MASCGGAIVKLLLGLFNLIWMCLGAFIIYLGSKTVDFHNDDIKTLIDTNFKTGSLVLIGFGIIMVLFSSIGFIGACCENSSLLNCYGMLMFLLLLANIAILFYGYKYKDTIEEKINLGIKNGITKFNSDAKMAYSLQKFQNIFDCCGWDGPSDYSSSLVNNLPSSCCGQVASVNTARDTCSSSSVTRTYGCKESPVIQKFVGSIAYSGVALILVQLVIILSACCLARDLRIEN